MAAISYLRQKSLAIGACQRSDYCELCVPGRREVIGSAWGEPGESFSTRPLRRFPRWSDQDALRKMRISMRHICNGNDSRPIIFPDILIGFKAGFKRLGGPAGY